VPEAKDWTTDQVPEAHCWKEVPPTQFQRPSGVQAEPAVMAPVVPEDEDDAGEDDGLAAGAAEVATVGAMVEVAMVVGAAALLTGIVAKTPGAFDVVAAFPAVAVAVAPDPDPEEASPQPTGALRFACLPGWSTEDPGFGKRISTPSVVPQESAPIFLMLAVNMFGKAL